MGNKQAAFTEDQLEDYQVFNFNNSSSSETFCFIVVLRLIDIYFFLFRIALTLIEMIF